MEKGAFDVQKVPVEFPFKGHTGMMVLYLFKHRCLEKRRDNAVEIDHIRRHYTTSGQCEEILNDRGSFLRGLQDLFNVVSGPIPFRNLLQQ